MNLVNKIKLTPGSHRMKISFAKWCLFLALMAFANLLYLTPAFAWPEEDRAAIVPSLARIAPGESQQFHAVQLPRRMQVSRAAEQVTWSVNGIVGGNDKVGFINETGLYHAPASAPASVHIGALVPDSTNKHLFATVLTTDIPQYRSIKQWPKKEFKDHKGEKILRITFDSKGHLLVNFEFGNLAQYTKDGEFIEAFGRNEQRNPIGGVMMVASSPSGKVYTGDLATGPPRINVYNPDGEWIMGFGQKGSRRGMVMTAVGLAIHPNGNVYVADQDSMRVSIYDSNHEFIKYLREYNDEGERVNTPSDIAFDASGDLFVASAYGPCEKVDPETGERIMAFAYPLPPEGMMYIDDICLDQWGDVYLAIRSGADVFESGPDHGGVASIMKFTNSGDYLTTINLSAKEPTRVAIEVDNEGHVYAGYATKKSTGIEVFAKE